MKNSKGFTIKAASELINSRIDLKIARMIITKILLFHSTAAVYVSIKNNFDMSYFANNIDFILLINLIFSSKIQ